MMSTAVNSQSCQYCYIDLDVDNHRSNLALTAAFVDATDSRYGFRSKDMRRLGGSELSRIHELMTTDHEWSCKLPPSRDKATTESPPHGSRIVFRLYWDVAPLACENFATLCTNGGNSLDVVADGGFGDRRPRPAPVGESGKGLTYRNSPIHRVVGGFVVQGGDFVFGNGSGGESIYGGRKFKDERAGLGLRHDGAGLLSMGNSGKNSNTSQFFVTLGPAPQCDGRHVVFGEVVSGMDVLRHVEGFAATEGGSGDPAVPVGVTDCGAFVPLFTPGAGSWYDRPDAGSYSGMTPEFVVRPRVGILAPNGQVAERFRGAMGAHASTTILVAAEDVGGDEEEVVRSALAQLERFALDVIVAAPACAGLMRSMNAPPSWHDAAKRIHGSVPNRGSVFIEAKPVDVIDAILSRSWVGTMRPGWLLSASFA